jgi:hypothetical protein
MIALGDDNLTFVSGPEGFVEKVKKRLKSLVLLGVQPENIFHLPQDLSKASFCSGWFFPQENRHIFVPKLGRALLKSGYTTSKNNPC